MPTIKVDVPRSAKDGYLGSQQYAELLQQYEDQAGPLLRAGTKRPIDATINLKRATWIGHLPLVALALVVERLAAAGVSKVEIELPQSGTTSAFLERWGFVKLAQQHQYKALINAADAREWGKSKTPRVLELTRITSRDGSPDLAADILTNDGLAQVLETAGFADEYDVSGLADLVVRELWTNAAEHSGRTVPGFATAHVSNPDPKTAKDRNDHASRWERRLFDKIGHEGITEIVVADGGIGFVESLRGTAAPLGMTEAKEIAEWAFDAYSTSKDTLQQHTRGLWAVKEKVRQLRGVLYAYTGFNSKFGRGGVELHWDFFNDPGQKHALAEQYPSYTTDGRPLKHPIPSGSYFQILLPHRTPRRRNSYVVYHTSVAETPVFRAVAHAVHSVADAEGIPKAVAALTSNQILFVDMSETKGWGGLELKATAAAISDAFLRSATHRLWLLNTPVKFHTMLSTAAPLIELWRDQGVLAPTASVTKRGGSVVHKFLVEDESHCKPNEPGDTPRARRTLVNGINEAIEGGRLTLDGFSYPPNGAEPLTPAERNWVQDALSRNQSLVDLVSRGTVVRVEPAFDVYALSNAAFRALLPIHLEKFVRTEIERQRSADERYWYLLPGNRYCNTYVSPHFLDQSYDLRSLVDEWMEEEISRTSPRYAISFSIYAERFLPMAKKAHPGVEPIYLHHYKDVHGEEGFHELRQKLQPKERAVFLVGISGSGRTLNRVAKEFAATGVDGAILCVLDTMTEEEWRQWPALTELRSKKRFRTLVTAPIEKLADKPEHGPASEWPVVEIDSQTLLPLRITSDRDKRLPDGLFWKTLAAAEALSPTRVMFRGHEIPTYIWPKKVLTHPGFVEIIRDEIAKLKPDSLVLAGDVAAALPDDNRRRAISLATTFELSKLDAATRFSFEGANVAALCFAASSGTEVARLLNALAYAREATIFIVINRMTPEIASAFIQRSRARIVTFQWLFINSPGSAHSFGRGEALLQLNEYRRSAQSHRLITFIDEKYEELLRGDTIVESARDDSDYEAARPPSPGLFLDNENYDLSSTAGRQAIEDLLRRAEAGDAEWVRNVLREAAARYVSWRRHDGGLPGSITGTIERLLVAAASNRNLEVYTVTLVTLLLERRFASADAESMLGLRKHLWARLIAMHNKAFVEGRSRTDHEACAAACIRAIGKFDAVRLIDALPDVLRIACLARETELTLALELSKLLRSGPLESKVEDALKALVAARAEAQRPHEWLTSAEHLFGDLGYRVEDATPIPWKERFARLASEVPDDDRTIQTLVQSIHALLRHARIVFYREFDTERFVVSDMWPRSSPGAKPIFVSGARTLAALRTFEGKLVLYRSVRTASAAGEAAAQHLARLLPPGTDRSVLLVRVNPSLEADTIRRRSFRGILRIDQFAPENELSDATAETIQEMADHTTELLARDPFFANAKMADWEYMSLVSEDPSIPPPEHDHRAHVLQRWTDRVRLLLGADLARLLVLKKPQWITCVTSGNWRGSPAQNLSFVMNDRRYLTVIAVERGEHMLAYDIQASDVKAMPPVPWVHGMACIPLMYESQCRAVLTLWHHARGWFHVFDRSLYESIAKAGGALNELTLLEPRISAAKEETMRDLIAQGSRQLTTQTLTAAGIVKRLQRGSSEPDDAAALLQILRQIDGIFRDLHTLQVRPVIRTAQVDVTDFIHNFARRHNAAGRVSLETSLPQKPFLAHLDTRAMDGALSEIIRVRSSELSPVAMILSLHTEELDDLYELRLRDAGPPLAASTLDALTSSNDSDSNGLAIAARIVRAHGGRIISAHASDGVEFVITLPVQIEQAAP